MRALSASLLFTAGLMTASLYAEEPVSPELQLSKAIRYQTVSFQDSNKIDYQVFTDFQQFLQESYPKTFSQLNVEKIAQYSLLLSWQGSDGKLKPVLFDAHYDVVPIEPGTEEAWEYPPFEGVIAEGYVWGRGALDDKVAVISTLEAVESLLASGYQPERTLLFSIAHDEEIGGNNGASNIARHIKERDIQLEYMVGEGGMVVEGSPLLPGKSMAMISLAEKTYVTLTLRATGAGGHSSNPVDDNAVVKLAAAVKALHENPFEPELVAPVDSMLQVLGEEIGGVKGFLMRNQWLSSSLLAYGMNQDPNSRAMVRSTTAVTMFNAGIKENVIPQKSEARVNFRLLPGVTPQQLIESVRDIVDDPAIEISASAWASSPPVADVTGVGYRRLERAIGQVLPAAVVTPGLLTATTDTPHYVELTKNIYRFHPFTLNMEEVKSIHNTNERIAVDSVVNAVALSRALIQSAAKR